MVPSAELFSCLCFIWAAIGLGSRLLIVRLGERWKDWEEHSAYSESRPKWLYAADLLAVAVVAFTWYMVWKTEDNRRVDRRAAAVAGVN